MSSFPHLFCKSQTSLFISIMSSHKPCQLLGCCWRGLVLTGGGTITAIRGWSWGECLWGAFWHDSKLARCLSCLEILLSALRWRGSSRHTRPLCRSSSKFKNTFPAWRQEQNTFAAWLILSCVQSAQPCLWCFIAVRDYKGSRLDLLLPRQTRANINNITSVYSCVKVCQGDTHWKLKVVCVTTVLCACTSVVNNSNLHYSVSRCHCSCSFRWPCGIS